jgi:hypothetical protein
MVLKTLPSAVAVISYAASESAGVFFPAPPPFGIPIAGRA